MSRFPIWILLIMIWCSSCIGDDIIYDEVDPVIRITNPIDSLEINTTYSFEFSYFNNVGVEEEVPVTWTSSDPSKIQIEGSGLANAISSGEVEIAVHTVLESGVTVRDAINVVVGESTVVSTTERSGSLQSTSSYTLRGDFTLRDESDKLVLSLASNYSASSSLPGLYIYLTNNPNTTSGAFEIGKVTVFGGAHSYDITGVSLNDFSHVLYFCKPFNVKVGDGKFDN